MNAPLKKLSVVPKDASQNAYAESDSKFTHGADGSPLTRREQAATLSSHFSNFFEPLVAMPDDSNLELRNAAMNIRHRVFSEELGLEPETVDKIETDEFDEYSIACLIKHIHMQEYAGTVRIVSPQNDDQLLPIQKFCSDSVSEMAFHPNNFPRNTICEISRLAVPDNFRKRIVDQFEGAAVGNINRRTYSETDFRFFPLISVGLYLTATAKTVSMGTNNVFVMVEPRLAKSMKMVGIKFQQIGPIVEYHGKRAPFYIDAFKVKESLSPGFKKMLDDIQKNIESK